MRRVDVVADEDGTMRVQLQCRRERMYLGFIEELDWDADCASARHFDCDRVDIRVEGV